MEVEKKMAQKNPVFLKIKMKERHQQNEHILVGGLLTMKSDVGIENLKKGILAIKII